jgi:hypothetical protein
MPMNLTSFISAACFRGERLTRESSVAQMVVNGEAATSAVCLTIA